jgi:hypothetical protein
MTATATRKLKPADLLPPTGGAAVETVYHIWTGLTDEAPRAFYSMCGISFPKLNGVLQKDEAFDNTEVQRTVRGSLNRVTLKQLREIKSRMARTVIRFHGRDVEAPLEDEPGSGRRHTHRAHEIITVPRPEDIKAAEKNDQPVHLYRPQPGDVGIAHFCYLVFTSQRGHDLPPVCAEAGFVDMPDDLEL